MNFIERIREAYAGTDNKVKRYLSAIDKSSTFPSNYLRTFSSASFGSEFIILSTIFGRRQSKSTDHIPSSITSFFIFNLPKISSTFFYLSFVKRLYFNITID